MILLWYSITLLISLFISSKIESQYHKNGLMSDKFGYLTGGLFSVCIAIFSFFIYLFGDDLGNILKSEMLLAVASLSSVHFLFMYGLRPLSGNKLILILLHTVSLIVALNFLLHSVEVNNIILCILTITLTVRLGYQINSQAFVIIIIAMCLFDVYAVWMSDIMQKMTSSYPAITPSGLLSLSYSGMKFLGAGDVIFSSLAVVHVRRKLGLRYGFLLCLFLIWSMVSLDAIPWRPFNPATFPCMVLISPLTLLVYIYGKQNIKNLR